MNLEFNLGNVVTIATIVILFGGFIWKFSSYVTCLQNLQTDFADFKRIFFEHLSLKND